MSRHDKITYPAKCARFNIGDRVALYVATRSGHPAATGQWVGRIEQVQRQLFTQRTPEATGHITLNEDAYYVRLLHPSRLYVEQVYRASLHWFDVGPTGTVRAYADELYPAPDGAREARKPERRRRKNAPNTPQQTDRK